MITKLEKLIKMGRGGGEIVNFIVQEFVSVVYDLQEYSTCLVFILVDLVLKTATFGAYSSLAILLFI